MQWEKFIRNLDKYYYGEWMLAFVEILVVILLIKLKPGQNRLINNLFIFYLSFDLFLLVVMCFLPYIDFISWPFFYKLQNILNTCITFIELSVYYYYFLILLGKKYATS